MHIAASGGMGASPDSATRSFSASGFLSTAHVTLQESPTGKILLLVRISHDLVKTCMCMSRCTFDGYRTKVIDKCTLRVAGY